MSLGLCGRWKWNKRSLRRAVGVKFIGVEYISDLCEIAHQGKKIPRQNQKRKFPGKNGV